MKSVIHNKPNKYIAFHYLGHPSEGSFISKLEEILSTVYEPDTMYNDYIQLLPEKKKDLIDET